MVCLLLNNISTPASNMVIIKFILLKGLEVKYGLKTLRNHQEIVPIFYFTDFKFYIVIYG